MKPAPFCFLPKRRFTGPYRSVIVVAVLLVLLSAVDGRAHRITVFAWVEGENVHVSGKFGGGRPAVDSQVEVFGSEGQKLLEGRTDDAGELVFPLPASREITVVLNAGSGHRAEWTIPASEIQAATGSLPEPRPPAEPPAASSREVIGAPDSPARETTGHGMLGPEQVEKIVEQALDKKLKPVLRMIAESRESQNDFRDIVGGVGYLVGLAGIAAYFLSRKNRNADHDG
jgi:nickel transport protein